MTWISRSTSPKKGQEHRLPPPACATCTKAVTFYISPCSPSKSGAACLPCRWGTVLSWLPMMIDSHGWHPVAWATPRRPWQPINLAPRPTAHWCSRRFLTRHSRWTKSSALRKRINFALLPKTDHYRRLVQASRAKLLLTRWLMFLKQKWPIYKTSYER